MTKPTVACAPCEDPDRPGHPSSLISLCCRHGGSKDPYLPFKHKDSDQTGRMPRLI